MSIQFLRFRIVLPKLRSCVFSGSERCLKISEISYSRVPSRSYMNRISAKYEDKLRTKDIVPEGFRLIYRGGMDKYVHLANASSMIMLVIAIAHITSSLFDNENVVSFPVMITEDDSLIGTNSYTEITIMYASSFAMLFMLRYISNAYVLRMYYNEMTKTYKAIRVGWLVRNTRQHNFPAKSLKRVPKQYVLPWRNATYYSNGQRMLIFEHGFRTNADYDRLFPDDTEDVKGENDDEDMPGYSK